MCPLRSLVLLLLAAAAVAADPPAAVARLANEVQPLLTAEHAREALAKLAAWRGEPHALVERLRGDAAMLAGDHPAAVAAYRRALALPEPPAGTRRNLAHALAAAGDERAAAGEFAVDLAGGAAADATAGDLASWVRALIGCGEARAAAQAAANARLRFPDDGWLRLAELMALESAEDWPALGAAAGAALARDGGDAVAWRALLAARAQDGGDGARDELAAVAIAARRAGALPAARCAAYLRHAGLDRAAAAAYRDALAEPSIAGEDRLLAAETFAATGDADAARAALAPLPADDARVRRLRARLALAAGDDDAARAEIEALIAAGAADGPVLAWSARLAERAGDLAGAVDRWQRAALDPASAREARLGLALALARLGRDDEAIAAAQTAVAADPGDRHARAVLAWIEDRGR